MRALRLGLVLLALVPGGLRAGYTNFEVSHVHPIARTPSGARLLALNTPDAVLEVFAIQGDGSLDLERSIPTGLEPVSVVARTDAEAWVVNQLSDTVSIVDLDAGTTLRTLRTGDEPTDVVFAAGKAFVTVAGEDVVKVFDLANLAASPTEVPLFSRKPRALARSADGSRVYAVTLFSGNQTTVINENEIWDTGAGLDTDRLAQLGLNSPACVGPKPFYPPLPPGIERNPALLDPQVDPQDPDNPANFPKVGLIVGFDEAAGQWRDEAGQDWSGCLPFRLPDSDLFVIDTSTLAVSAVAHLGTALFDVAVQPGTGKLWVPNTDSRNRVRFEHELGVRGHLVENRLSIVDPAAAYSVARIDLNAHIDRASNPAANLPERLASVSQPGMLVWDATGTEGYLTGLGSRKVFRVDGTCTSPACIFGPSRAAPEAVETGEGPSGVAFDGAHDRLYVLHRFSNTLAIVEASTLTKLDEVPLHDPSPMTDKLGRRFLYDAIVGSGHGDAACSSCHLSGDRDDLAWDLGDPTGTFVPYTGMGDNVRFIVPVGGNPFTCPDPLQCATHDGFDPQKGPMATQTLRGMLEPLHWRKDRPTMNAFNGAFVGLMGTADRVQEPGPNGLSPVEMEQFRQFALRMRFPPNPNRNVEDTLPTVPVPVRGTPFVGTPSAGEFAFNNDGTDANQPCQSCHSHPFGAAGGQLGGVTPTSPTSAAAAGMFNGAADQNNHNDMGVPHLRNMYEKIGPRFGNHVEPPPLARSGIGFIHDGSVADLGTFLSNSVFTMTAQQVRDVAAFMTHFPTGTPPSVGQQLTLPQGAPPTGSTADENLLGTLLGLGDLADAGRHCELVVATRLGGTQQRRFRWSGGAWASDIAGEPARTTLALRTAATAPLTFLCTPIDSGRRLGGDRDEDTVLDGNDCNAADPGAWNPPGEVTGLVLAKNPGTVLSWNDASASTGPGLRYEILGGQVSTLRASGLAAATACVAGALATLSWPDPGPNPPPGDGRFWIVRGRNSCGVGSSGPGRAVLDTLECP